MYQIIQKRKIWLTLSSCLVGLSIIFIVIFGLNLGIDFTGGSLLEVKFLEDRPEPQAISDIVASVGIEGDIVVQPTGEKNAIIRFQSIEEETHQLIFDQLKESFDDMQDAVSLLTSTSNTQETRISLLELACSKIPPTILEDVAIMKSQLRFYQKFMMLITGSIVGIIFKLVFSDFF